MLCPGCNERAADPNLGQGPAVDQFETRRELFIRGGRAVQLNCKPPCRQRWHLRCIREWIHVRILPYVPTIGLPVRDHIVALGLFALRDGAGVVITVVFVVNIVAVVCRVRASSRIARRARSASSQGDPTPSTPGSTLPFTDQRASSWTTCRFRFRCRRLDTANEIQCIITWNRSSLDSVSVGNDAGGNSNTDEYGEHVDAKT